MMLSSLPRTFPEIALLLLCELKICFNDLHQQFQSQNIPIRSIATAVKVTQHLI
jgi:hypothetical protein